MTDKQIIIDGVPVQDCCYFDYENDGYEDSCYIHQNECSAQNCYYKQLKRKEQECEELKRQRQADKGLITATGKMNYELLQEYDKLKTALTEIKEFFNEECIICKENYINITGEICEECKYKNILQKISECEANQ